MTSEQPIRDPRAALLENIRLSALEAPVYDRNHFEIFHPWEQHRLLRQIRRAAANCTAVDIGAGTGNAISKLPRSAMRVAVDLSVEMLGEARKLDPALHLIQAEAGLLPFKNGSFDLVLTYSTLHHLPDLDAALSEFRRILTPGGVMFLDHEERFQESGWRGWLYQKLRRLLRAVAKAWYWRRRKAKPWLPYRRTPWPLSSSLGDVDFGLTEGGHVDPRAIEATLSGLGLEIRRQHYLLEPLPMMSVWQEIVQILCRLLRMGHFFIEARASLDPTATPYDNTEGGS